MTGQRPQPDLSALTANAIAEAAKKHLDERRTKEAITLLETAVRLWPNHGRVRHQLGQALMANGDGEGVRHLQEAVSQEPTNVDRLADLAVACEALGDPRAAEIWFRRALVQAPTRADLLLHFASSLARAQRYNEAETRVRHALALKHPFGHGYATLGSIQQRAGRMAEAIESFFRATQVEPEYSDAYLSLAGALNAVGAPADQVMRPARIAADRFPGRVDAVGPVVQYLRDRGMEDTYVEYATRLIDIEMEKAARDEFGAHGFRIIIVDGILNRIGEIAFQLDLHVKMKKLGWLPPFVSIMLAPRDLVCNWSFLDYWRPYVTVVDDPKLIEKLAPLKARVPFNLVYVRMPNGKAISKARAYFAVQEEWQRQGRDVLLHLSQSHVDRGREGLRRMGMPDGAWFVGVHVREPGFLKEAPGSSEAFRNANIAAYLPAMEEITRRGGWVIRLGDPSMTPLPAMPQVVDYAVSPLKSEEMDVFLMASCRFLLGTTSGPVMVSELFGVPVGAADYFPIGGLLHTSKDVIIPKPYRHKATGRMLHFEEYLKMPLAFTYDSEYFDSLGLEALNSEPEDILDLVIEMLERTEGQWPYDAEDEKLNARWHEISRPFTLGQVGCRVGRGFLRRHRHLFQTVP
jgi:putative glycosyltransferase (TIGR04372 family)